MANFTNEQHKQHAKYKLWVKYKPEWTNERLPGVKVYYSIDKKSNADYGIDRLTRLVNSRRQKISIAIIYDNISNREVRRFT